MKFRPIELVCACGQQPARIESVGLTSEYELVMQWTCDACRQRVYATKTLLECCRECPEPSETEPAPVPAAASEADDAQFLKELGIRFP